MRIIGGQYRSRPLRSLPGMDTRPTSDRLRETLFNILSAARDLTDTVWLDVFAGTGAVGIEALSRGAANVYFLEQARKAAALIRDNLRSLGIAEGFEVLERDATIALRALEAQGVAADVCFLDPPYQLHDAYADVLSFVASTALLRPDGIAIAEHDKRFDPGERMGALGRYRLLVQGDAALSFYRRA